MSTAKTSNNSKARRWSDAGAGWGFLTPWIIGFLVFSAFPIIFSFVLSLTKWNMLGTPQFVGLDNYKNLFSGDSEFAHTLGVTFVFTIINVGISIFFSLILAILLNLKVRFKGLFQFFYYVPTIMPSVVMAGCLVLMFNPQLGIVNYVLKCIGVTNPPNWTGSNTLVWVVVAYASVFTFQTGQQMLVFSAALKDVPQELYEAASLDGANAWTRFWHVTIPGIAPMLLFNTVSCTVNSFNGAFTLLYPLTGGGPGDATKVLGLDIYNQAFKNFNMGQASTLAVVLFIIVAIIGAVEFKLMDRN
ncbi:carbohydrate ABC transporter permease [Bifidobacterium sp. UBA6881]|uniref:carbohydrate ABC transporter permease n=1 Tax=Bifidobacterium sp. UBA6881 TaxID=1946109 RepID=UPI0025C0012F|nr:sugar ABC transporter permease [Bifidobacterium sp. UBA6881]